MTGKYEEIGAEIGRLVDRKQKAYGRSFDRSGEVLRILYPAGIGLGQYGDVLAIVRILDKFFRIATDRNALGEDPWKDVAGYALLSNRDLETEGDRKAPAGSIDGSAIRTDEPIIWRGAVIDKGKS